MNYNIKTFSQLSDNNITISYDELLAGSLVPNKNMYFDYGYITLFLTTKGKFAFIDTEDRDLLDDYVWCDNKGYARNKSQGLLHRVIMKRLHPEISDEFDVDHIDQNKFNNTRANLRYVTHSENLRNVSAQSNNKSTGIKGLYDRTEEKRFQCRRVIKGITYTKSFCYKKIRSYDEAKESALDWLKEFDNNNPIISIS
jgi:hypothetical protein